MQVNEAIRTKRAVRLFTDQPVPDEILLQILDAGRRSQSSKNTQPWQFVVVRAPATLQALAGTGDYAGHLAGAAFGVALVGATDSGWNMFDLGQASAYLQLAAWELGIGSCIAAIFDTNKAKTLLGIPAEMSFTCALSFGYPSPNNVTARMGGRKPIDQVVRWEKWE
ncbi:MAG: nitroreductase family protein [Chloroflexota bacterium]|nr:nitroreductase family protein [Chloroflexota bacterium]